MPNWIKNSVSVCVPKGVDKERLRIFSELVGDDFSFERISPMPEIFIPKWYENLTQEEIEKEKFRVINEKHQNAWLKTVWYNSIFFPVAEIVSSITVGLIVWFGGLQNVANVSADEYGTIFSFILLSSMLFRPLRQIADNGGIDGSVVADNVREHKSIAYGYNANTGEYGDMFKAGVVDPVKVVRTALANAGSISGLMLTTEALVTNYDEEDGDKKRVQGSIA